MYDILIACQSIMLLEKIKASLSLKFEMVDRGRADFFLGMEIEQDITNKLIKISQKQFIDDLLQKFDMTNSRDCYTPVDPGHKLKICSNCKDCKLVDEKYYRSMIGGLLYLGITSRPDIYIYIS